jgi:High potential iron-sulfur protein
MNATRRGLLLSGIGTASALAVSGTTFANTRKVAETIYKPEVPEDNNAPSRYAAGAICGNCSFFRSRADDAFAVCPMSSRASRWQHRTWCSAFGEKT